MERDTSLVARMLAELEADPATDALRRRGGGATECELRAMKGAWVTAALRAVRRATAGGRKAAGAARPAGAAQG